MKNRGQILAQNIVFIILNLIFLSLLVLFVISRTGTSSTIEEKYAKDIALMIDSAKPGMVIHLNMEDAIKEAEKNKYTGDLVLVQNNSVTVRLRNKGGFSYSFFNDVDVSVYPDSENKDEYVITINNYK